MNTSNATTTPAQKHAGHHALVIGGSIAGLLATRVLADYFDTVTIIDRDVFPITPDHRKGVPQSHHAHGLLATGRYIIEQLFPGIMNDLAADGATSASNIVPISIVSPKGLLPLSKQPGEIINFSRCLLEWHIRDRVSKLPEVRIITNTEVTGLQTSEDRTRVVGVQIRERGQESHSTTLHADLVVDASGRHSQTPQWLVELGYEAPPIEMINSDLRYASRFYAKPEHFPAEWQNLIVNGRPPHTPAGLILSVDHERWHVTLGGMTGQYPPTDEAGFLQWARNLSDPSIYEALRVAQPLTPIRVYRTPDSHLRHFEQLQRWPSGFIVTGDAVCAFNPIYGQGMTVSAMDAMTLKRCLQEQQRSPKPDFEQRFQQQLTRTIADAWLVSTNEDLRWPGIALSGARPRPGLRLLHRYMDLVLYSAVVDPMLAHAYFSVIMMANPPRTLIHPHILTRILSVAGKRLIMRLSGHEEKPALALSPTTLASLRAMPEANYTTMS